MVGDIIPEFRATYVGISNIPVIGQVRSGGITPWLKMAGMTEAFNLPVISHGVPETHVHLVGAAPNGLSVEYMPRLFPLWKEVPRTAIC